MTQIIERIRANAPAELAQRKAWVIWKLEQAEGASQKPRKVPRYANGARRTGRQGSPADRKQLVTLDEALEAAAKSGADGVGIALLPELGITILDFDNCVTDGRVRPEVEAMLRDTYAEYSPSGTGVHGINLGALGDRKSGDRQGWPFGFETFNAKGFVTFTGDKLPGSTDTIAPLSPGVVDLYRERFSDSEHTSSGSGEPMGLDEADIRACLSALDPDLDHDEWLAVGMAIHHETRGDGFELWNQWSARGHKYPENGDDVLRLRWESFGSDAGNPVTARTLLHLAGDVGRLVKERVTTASADDFEDLGPDPESEQAEARGPDPVALDWNTLPTEPPEAQFIAPGWLPDGVVTLFAAHGGTGKSYLALYIALCLAVGVHPFDPTQRIQRCRVLLYSAEDDLRIMQGRLIRYMRLLGVTPEQVDGWLLVLDATDSDNVLFTADTRGHGRTTARFTWLAEQVEAFGARLLIFDTAADGFGGGENDRAHVRQFMSALKRLASAVLLLSHVDAASSMADPDDAKGYSGSTAWSNSARSRWFMARRKGTDDIVLTLPKVNYAKAGAEAIIRWRDDYKVFAVVTARDRRLTAADHRADLLVLLEDAIRSGQTVSLSRNSARSVWNTLQAMPGFPVGLKSPDVAQEVLRWQGEGLIREVEFKRDNRATGRRLELTEAGHALAESARVVEVVDAD